MKNEKIIFYYYWFNYNYNIDKLIYNHFNKYKKYNIIIILIKEFYKNNKLLI